MPPLRIRFGGRYVQGSLTLSLLTSEAAQKRNFQKNKKNTAASFVAVAAFGALPSAHAELHKKEVIKWQKFTHQ